MDEKLLRVIDLMAQLRDAVIECDYTLSCNILTGIGGEEFNGGVYAAVHVSDDCGVKFCKTRPHSDDYDKQYSFVNGVMVFCLTDKEEA